jgi:hypothetical protein
MRWVVVLLVCLWSSPVWAQEAPVEGEEARAQAQVEEARRLLKVRRFPEAIKLLEDAWLVMEDPELLRMLAEAHLEAGDRAAASHYRDEYLADPRVGESAKAAARERFAALAGEEEEEEGWGFTGWQSGGGGGGQAGGMYLGVMARLHYGEGGEFVGVGPRLEGQGEAPVGR